MHIYMQAKSLDSLMLTSLDPHLHPYSIFHCFIKTYQHFTVTWILY